MTFFKGYPIGWIGWKLLTRLGVKLQLSLRIYDISTHVIGFCINKDEICTNNLVIKHSVEEVKKELVIVVIDNLMNNYKITSNIGIDLDICKFVPEEKCEDITKFKA